MTELPARSSRLSGCLVLIQDGPEKARVHYLAHWRSGFIAAFAARPPDNNDPAVFAMKLYCFFTESHEYLKDEFFLPSLKDAFEVVAIRGVQTSTAQYMEPGWNSLILQKVAVIERALDESDGEAFVYSDVDVQFMRPVEAALRRSLERVDMAMQRDAPDGTLCAGFFVSVANTRTRALWREIRRLVEVDTSADDQGHLNRLLVGPILRLAASHPNVFALLNRGGGLRRLGPLLGNRFGVRWRYLSDEFLGGGTLCPRIWEPGMAVAVPAGTRLHHANWTVGTANKIALMQAVRVVAAGSSAMQRT